jgi:alpha-glucosidase
MRIPIIFILSWSASFVSAAPTSHTTSSPDGRLEFTASLADDGGFTYTLRDRGTERISRSALGLAFGKNGSVPSTGWRGKPAANRSHDGVWKPLWGKRSVVPDQYHETIWELAGPIAPVDKLRFVVRAYNDGVAFRYEIPSGTSGIPATATADLTEYQFAGDYTAWFYNGENHNLGPDKLSAITGERLPVMTVQAAADAFFAVHEADLRSGEPLRLEKSGSTGFRALAAPGEIAAGWAGPWRVIFAAATPGAMVDSHLLELLNPDPEGDFSWVKPGVCTWDWRIDGAKVDGFTYGMNYESWVRMIDFSAAMA